MRLLVVLLLVPLAGCAAPVDQPDPVPGPGPDGRVAWNAQEVSPAGTSELLDLRVVPEGRPDAAWDLLLTGTVDPNHTELRVAFTPDGLRPEDSSARRLSVVDGRVHVPLEMLAAGAGRLHLDLEATKRTPEGSLVYQARQPVDVRLEAGPDAWVLTVWHRGEGSGDAVYEHRLAR